MSNLTAKTLSPIISLNSLLVKLVETVRSSLNKFYKPNKSVRDIADGHAPCYMPGYLANHMNAYRTELRGREPG